MRCYIAASLLVLSTMASTSGVHAATELSVDVYEGPKECEEGDKVKSGDFLSMHYTGTIHESSETGEKGSKFDSSRDRGQTFDFQIGQGQVIPGWDQGIVGLCKGAKANIIIPPAMGYGDGGAGGAIPGGATLHFDVEVVDIKDGPPPPPNVFDMIDTDKDGKLSKDEIAAWFTNQGSEVPAGIFESEDKDGDGVISWEEFSGPKGDAPTKHDEL